MTPFVGRLAIVAVVFSTSFCIGAMAVENEPEQAVRTGQEAFSSHWDLSWYDSQTDALHPIDLKSQSRTNANWNWDWSWWWGFLRILGWIALTLLLGGLAYMLIVIFLRRETSLPGARADHSAEKYVLSPESVEALPMGAETPVWDLLAAARRCYEQGDFQRAIILLFSHQLVQLDKHHLLRLTKGKTNRQYLQEIHRQAPSDRLVPMVEQTMLLFEQAFFGRHKPSREQFESCWTQLDTFDSILANRAEATA